MVIIHGGGFVFGSALAYRDYYDFSDNFLSKGIVVVTIQYRLGVEGFASTGDTILPGNLGLWDQVAALRFIKENIAGFGGDPNRITLFGFSAGAASVSALTVAPSSRDLFSQAIEISGTALAQWAHNDYVADETRHLADALGCNATSSEDVKTCLKRSTSDEIRAAVMAIGPTTRTLHLVKFGPRIDGDFFPSIYEELVKKAPAKPTFAGFVEEEATLFTILNGAHGTLHLFGAPLEEQATFGEEDFVRFVNDVIVTERDFGNSTAEVRKKIVDFYLSSDSSPNKDNVFYLRKYTQLCSDTLYNIPILREAREKVQRHWLVYLYKHTYLHKIPELHQQFPALFDAAYHSHDHRLLFRGNNHVIRAIGFDLASSTDARVADFWVDSVSAFVKTGEAENGNRLDMALEVGVFVHISASSVICDVDKTYPTLICDSRNPSSSMQTWAPATSDSPSRYMEIGSEPTMRDGLFDDRLRFWNSLAESYGLDIVNGRAVGKKIGRSEL